MARAISTPPTVLTDIPRKRARLPRRNLRARRVALPRRHARVTPSAWPTTPTFGLGASVWTRDPAEQRCIHRANPEWSRVRECSGRFRPALAVRWCKTFRYGRELSRDGIREFVNVKTILIAE